MIKGYANKPTGETKTLGEWIEELDIIAEKYTFPETGNTYDFYKSSVKKDRNGYIDIYRNGGYGLLHCEVSKYIDKPFVMVNNDINDAKLVQRYE